MVIAGRTQRHVILLLAAASLACAPAPREGETVHISEESAIIIWDATSKTEHFIRRASFDTKAKDFGFLVPTPTTPKLAEADDDAFDRLKRITAPPVRRMDPSVKSEQPMRIAAPAAAPAVVVIATAKVAGYDAAVLEASDAVALDLWLKEHGYHSSPALVGWFKPYVAQKWKITAFKIASGASNATRVESSAIRMSFDAEQPFFPYREPVGDGKTSQPRMLRVFLLADTRQDGSIGVGGKWNGRTVWSNRISESERTSLLKELKLPDETARSALHLTEFEDASAPRPGIDDLLFRAAADQSTVAKAEVDYYGRAVNSPLENAKIYGGGLLAASYALFWIPGLLFGACMLLYLLLRRIFSRK